MWNDTDIPLGYLITFRCYGTWLHGDERGSIDRFNNQYRNPYIPENKNWRDHNTKELRGEPVVLDAAQRTTIEYAVRETCDKRKWFLYAINARTSHIHSVISAGKPPGLILNAVKANATRMMKENGIWKRAHSPWADKGSKRRLWTEKSIEIAVDYVVNGQGGPLPDFD